VWRKRLRIAIAVFVVIFAAVVVASFRKGQRRPPDVPAPKGDPKALVQTIGRGVYERQEQGKIKARIEFGRQATYEDNRSVFGDGVRLILPDKSGRRITVDAQEGEVTTPPGKAIGVASLKGGVKLVTSDGITVSTATANYDDNTGIAQIPGPLTFTKGRMTGRSVGGTYDRNREVFWLLDQAKVDVVPDEKGAGAMHVTAKSAGMARLEHYMKFVGGVRFDGEGHVTEADEATAYLTPDNEKVQRMELRGNSRMTSKPGQSGPQALRARDIDLAYAEDGRTLQTAHLIEDASVQLPGDPGKPGRRIAGKAIDVALAPDGATVTNLLANDHVQVDLPADGDTPARRIRAAALLATGKPGTGIQAATFNGDVEYHESRAARGNVAAIDRSARSARMEVQTKPGFGDIEKADFHNNVHFTEGTDTTADAPYAQYSIAADRLDLSPGEGDTGKGPHVADGRIAVEARNIHMTLGAQTMKVDTNVRSVMQPQNQQQNKDKKQDPVRVPSMLKQDQPVNVKSNRLDYDGAKSVANYSGNSRLWQEGPQATVIQADTIVLEDKTGNMHAATNVRTVMTITESSDKKQPEAKEKQKQPEPTTTVAQDLVYEDGKHRATYTGTVHMSGPDGDVTADKIELFLAEQGGQLERAEADGNVVSRQQMHRAYGTHLTYVSKDELYTMVGTPVKMYDDQPPNCKVTTATTLTFDRNGNRSTASGNGTAPQHTEAIACGSAPGH
jgi:lipopolysaccharide export system protein LptA